MTYPATAHKLAVMPDLATIALILLVALAIWWKARCIWRGCSVEPEAGSAKRSGSRHI